ncbi:MAG TPA: hypothetical protein VIJ42_06325, partial [Stellaceae bacterium]
MSVNVATNGEVCGEFQRIATDKIHNSPPSRTRTKFVAVNNFNRFARPRTVIRGGPRTHDDVCLFIRVVAVEKSKNSCWGGRPPNGIVCAKLVLQPSRRRPSKQRTMLANAIRGHAAEFGVTAATG